GGLGTLFFACLYQLWEGQAVWYEVSWDRYATAGLLAGFLGLSFHPKFKFHRIYWLVVDLYLFYLLPLHLVVINAVLGLPLFWVTCWTIVLQLVTVAVRNRTWMKAFVASQILSFAVLAITLSLSWIKILFIGACLTLVLGINFYIVRHRMRSTERYLKEKEERERDNSLLLSLINSTSDLIWAIDRNLTLIAANPAFTKWVRQSFGKAIQTGDHLTEVIAQSGELKELISHHQFALKGKALEFEKAFTWGEEKRWYALAFNPITQGGGVIGASIFARDITDRKLTEDRLKASEDRYAMASAGSDDWVWEWDIENNQLFLSEMMVEFLGLPPREKYDPAEWLNCIHPEDIGSVMKDIMAHLKGETDQLYGEYRMITSTGKNVWILGRGRAVRNEQGWALRLAGTQTDITQRKETELMLHKNMETSPNGIMALEAVRD
ncbi:MAG: PAS domain-containing protein, partial [Bacteroidota bacterium]